MKDSFFYSQRYYILSIFFLVLLSRSIGIWSFALFDDAFISLRQGMNLFDHGVFHFNINERVTASSAPIFAIISGLLYKIGCSPEFSIPAFNAVCDLLLCLLIAYRYQSTPSIGLMFSAVYLACFSVLRVSSGGMEASLFNLFMALALHNLTLRKYLLCGVILALSIFVRLEALIMLSIFFVYLTLFERHGIWRFSISSGIILSVLLGSMYVYYGNILPHSVIAKSHVHGNMNDFLLAAFVTPLFGKYFIALIGLSLGFVIYKKQHTIFKDIFLSMWLVFTLLYILAYCIKNPAIWVWYTIPIFPSICLLISITFYYFMRQLSEYYQKNIPKFIYGTAIITHLYYANHFGENQARLYLHRSIEQFCNTVKDTDVIAAIDLGVIGYYCYKNTIVDLAGLASPKVVAAFSPNSSPFVFHEKMSQNVQQKFLNIISQEKAQYLILFTDGQIMRTIMNTGLYTPIQKILKTEPMIKTDIILPEDFKVNEWEQNYYIFSYNK